VQLLGMLLHVDRRVESVHHCVLLGPNGGRCVAPFQYIASAVGGLLLEVPRQQPRIIMGTAGGDMQVSGGAWWRVGRDVLALSLVCRCVRMPGALSG
jgi:hypothetical protein